VMNRVLLNVSGVVSDLKSKGWKTVSPPYKAGDVITWNHNGHIGFIDGKGQAISNSSSLRTPRRNGIYYMSVTQVLRQS